MTTQTLSPKVIDEPADFESDREASATRIRELMKDWTRNTLGLGEELARIRDTFPRDPNNPTRNRLGFMKWCKHHTALSQGQITKLIQIYRKFGHHSTGNDPLPHRVMQLLSVDTVPDSARDEAMERKARGEVVGEKQAKEIRQRHRLPSPVAANAQAKEERRPVLASDGYIYFGADPKQAKEGEDRRTMVYGIRRALDTLGNIKLTANEFLKYALPHQLWTKEESEVIRTSLRWLRALNVAWNKRKP
jgi:hypothetical protein